MRASIFALDVLSHTDTGSDLVLELECQLQCDGLMKLIASGDAKTVLRLTCYRTSYRDTFDLNPSSSTIIRIEKEKVSGSLDLQAMVVATKEIRGFKLPELNQDFFANAEFSIRKGDVLANEPGITVKLNTTLEKNMAGIVLVRGNQRATTMSVSYAETTTEDPESSDYIYITLPDMDYKNYARLMNKRHLKNGVERFVQASIILPAITEAVSRLRTEKMFDDDDEQATHHKGTVWADSVYAALAGFGITELSSCTQSDYELANLLLGNVTSDSISNLMQKLTEWSTIREEDPNL